MYGSPDWFSALLPLVLSVAMLYDRVSPDDPDENTVEAAREAYVTGDIDEAEFERRVETYLDPETEQIREAVTPVQGIGPELSLAIARSFDSLDELRHADREELEDVNGIGESRAKAIRERFRWS
jgi:DNA integrity scanning protein DisA with diadenylate cyclase activity